MITLNPLLSSLYHQIMQSVKFGSCMMMTLHQTTKCLLKQWKGGWLPEQAQRSGGIHAAIFLCNEGQWNLAVDVMHTLFICCRCRDVEMITLSCASVEPWHRPHHVGDARDPPQDPNTSVHFLPFYMIQTTHTQLKRYITEVSIPLGWVYKTPSDGCLPTTHTSRPIDNNDAVA